jgi:hypothetical protein
VDGRQSPRDAQGESPSGSNARRHHLGLVPELAVLRWLPDYQSRWLGWDVAAAVAVRAVLEGHHYATASAGVDDYLHRHPGLRPTSQPAAR